MDFKTWLSKENNVKTLYISDEYFVHFTTEDRARQILKSGKLLIKPPYEKFGTDTVDAVSTMLGVYVPNVQTKHIKRESFGEDSSCSFSDFSVACFWISRGSEVGQRC